jgi:hypothetical protein
MVSVSRDPAQALRLHGVHLLAAAMVLAVSPVLLDGLLVARTSFPQFVFSFLIGGLVVGLFIAPGFDRREDRPVRCVLMLTGRCCAFFTVMIILLYDRTSYGLGSHLYAGPNLLFMSLLWWILNLAPLLIMIIAALAWRENTTFRLWVVCCAATLFVVLTTSNWRYGSLGAIWLYVQMIPLNPLPLFLLFAAVSFGAQIDAAGLPASPCVVRSAGSAGAL